MKAIKIIVSAWSVAFIIMFFVVLASTEPSDPSRKSSYILLIFVLFSLAVTGVGWLWYRSGEKDHDNDSGA
jgi:hypothetical protein